MSAGDPRDERIAWLERLRGPGKPDPAGIMRDLEWLAGPGRSLLTVDDPRYPAQLAAVPGMPAALFVRGDPALLARPQVAIVGSRAATAAGCETAFDFAARLAAHGFAITSGLATGIDAAAHRGALAAGGVTIAVCGTGLDRVYPAGACASSRTRSRRRARSSASSRPARRPPPHNFPRRNRLMSGLARGVLVVEAAARSGSLITARLAGEQGREVMAVPGSIHNPLARGCHRLIKDGAALVETVDDVLAALGASRLESATNSASGRARIRENSARHVGQRRGNAVECARLRADGSRPTGGKNRTVRTVRHLEAAVARARRPGRVPGRRAVQPDNSEAGPMKDSVLDILIHLFENFLDAEDDSTPDRDALKTELEQAGYPEAEIERALVWLESLATDPDRALGEGTARAVRVFSGSEQIRLDTDVRGYLLHLENLGILSAAQREVVIDRLLALEADDIDIEQLKWVVLMVLFSQPGQENAYQRMEDLVFDERRDAMH